MTADDACAPLLAVVDDAADFRALVRRVAEPLGWRVAEHENGRSALAADHDPPPALIVLDVLMPEGDGVETVGPLMRRWPGRRLVIASGGPSPLSEAARRIAEHEGAAEVRVLAKPASLGEIRAALEPRG